MSPAVLRLGDCSFLLVAALLSRLGLELQLCDDGSSIPGSWWGDAEAGLQANRVMARRDTPLHSILHESCHYLCMDGRRRQQLDTNAGGDYDEENAVCYLQILLADEIPQLGREGMFRDMDAWGYSFRLGSARAWFEGDAEDARAWLVREGLIAPSGQPTFRCRP